MGVAFFCNDTPGSIETVLKNRCAPVVPNSVADGLGEHSPERAGEHDDGILGRPFPLKGDRKHRGGQSDAKRFGPRFRRKRIQMLIDRDRCLRPQGYSNCSGMLQS